MIPKVYGEWTSEIMNVQEHVDAIPGTDLAAVKAAGLDPTLLAARGVEAMLKMILVDGFFHADPHPGNVFYLPGNRIAMIDCGMVGRLSPTRRNQVVDLLAGLAHMDEDAMLDVLLDWAGDAFVDEARLAADVNELVFDYEGVPLKEIRIGTLLRGVRDDHPRALDRPAVRSHADVQGADHDGGARAPVRPGVPRARPPHAAVCAARSPSATSPAGVMRRGRTTLAQVAVSSPASRAISRGCCATRAAARRGSISISSGWTTSGASSTAPSIARRWAS